MNIKKIILLLVVTMILTFTLNSAFGTNSEESNEDIRAGCREGKSLVLRLIDHKYICTSPSSAESWKKLGLAEIIQDAKNQTKSIKEMPIHEQTTIILKKPVLTITHDVQCREGYTLVYRFVNKDTFCTSPSSAESWKKLGLAEIIQNETSLQKNEEPPKSIKPIEKKEENSNKSTSSKEISNGVQVLLPPYPDEPSISQEILATNDYRYPPEIHKVNDRIWVAVGYDLANSVMIEGEKGIIIIDTLSTYESAKNVIKEFRKITDKPVKTIILTSGNLEYAGGTKAFLEEGDENVEIISHENHLNFYINQNILIGKVTGLRNQYVAGSLLPNEESDKNNLKNIAENKSLTIGYVPPTDTFSNEFNLDISGVKMNLVHFGGESSDQVYIWFPDDHSLLIGDNIYGIFPNTRSLSGGMYHDPMNYVNTIDKVKALGAESLILSHVKPVLGKENVQDNLILTRDATQYVYDQTIRGINNGYTADELSNFIKLPQSLENYPWLTYQKGQIAWNVKQIYYGVLGWFDGEPSFLQSVSLDKKSSKIVEGFGGTKNVLLDVRKAIESGEYEWATELATYVLNVDHENIEAKLLKAHSLHVLGQRALTTDGRKIALTNALELEGKITIDSSLISQMNAGEISEVPIEKLLYVLPTKLKSDKADRINESINIFYPDIDKWFTFYFRHSILDIEEGSDIHSRYQLILDTKTHKSIMTGDLKLLDAINSKQIGVKGDTDNILYMMGLIQDSTDGIPLKFKT